MYASFVIVDGQRENIDCGPNLLALVSEVLRCWNEEETGEQRFEFVDMETGEVSAWADRPDAEDCPTLARVWINGMGTMDYDVRYVLDADGSYDRTDINPLDDEDGIPAPMGWLMVEV